MQQTGAVLEQDTSWAQQKYNGGNMYMLDGT